jgi:hypothetical protein
MSRNNVVPFILLANFFDNVKLDNFDVMTGDCKICKTANVKIYDHACWKALREESKKIYAKEEEEATKET